MSVTEEQVRAAIDKCAAPGDNLGFFGKQEMDAGERLGSALDLYNLVKDSVTGQRVLRADLRVLGQKRVSKNIALVVTKLALEPKEPAHDSQCSDYARVLEHMAKAGATRAEFVAVFSNGEFKVKLQEARTSSPKRKKKDRAEGPAGVAELQIVFKGLGSAKTILATTPLPAEADIADDQQWRAIVMNMIARTTSDESESPPKQEPDLEATANS